MSLGKQLLVGRNNYSRGSHNIYPRQALLEFLTALLMSVIVYNDPGPTTDITYADLEWA